MKVFIVVFMFVGFLFAANVVNAVKVPGNLNGIGVNSKAWLSAMYYDVYLYPQTTVDFHDELSSDLSVEFSAKKAKIKVLYNDKNIAYLLEWDDNTHSVQDEYEVNSFGDGFAVQIPTHIENADKLPYIGMGNDGREVLVYLKKEVDCAIYEKAFVSKGFDSIIETKEQDDFTMDLSYVDGKYKGVLVRPIKDEYTNIGNDVSVSAFAIWDGSRGDMGGFEKLTSWIPIKLDGKDSKFLRAIDSFGGGDVVNGKQLTAENCATCHRYADVNEAPKSMAPNMTNIGGYSTSEYLLESIITPNAVVVPQYSKGVHLDFQWYSVDDSGVKTSTMPSFEWMDDKSKKDIVTYLKTLKSEIK